MKGHSAVVVGGTSGVGLEVSRLLAEAGVSRLVLVGRKRAVGEAAALALRATFRGIDARFEQCDVTRQDECDRLFVSSPIDILVHTAGGNLAVDLFSSMAPERYEDVIDGHFLSFVRCCHAARQGLVESGGKIVVVASDAGKVATPGEAMVGAMKAATMMFVRTLAMEWKRDGIRVNCVSPSIIEGTASFDQIMAQDKTRRIFEKAVNRAHLGVPTAEDVAKAVLYFCGEGAERVTGQVLSVNGGISAA